MRNSGGEERSQNLFILGQGIQEHVVSKNVQFIASPSHFTIRLEGSRRIVRAEIGLKQALVSVRCHREIPFLDQT